MRSWSDHLFSFYNELQPPPVPPGISWLFPQKDPAVMKVVRRFLNKYYHDRDERTIMLGINPGRLGAGVTGVNFTAPRQLTEHCAIEHPFSSQTELSAEFIYQMIDSFGGAQAFYSRFFIGSVCPLGFTKEGKNINYYDDRELLGSVEPFIIHNMNRLLQGRVNRQKGFCIGGEKNFRYLSKLNEAQGWFGELVPLPHPRFIMQYRRKQVPQFIHQYIQAITK